MPPLLAIPPPPAVARVGDVNDQPTLHEAVVAWQASSRQLRESMDALFKTLEDVPDGH